MKAESEKLGVAGNMAAAASRLGVDVLTIKLWKAEGSPAFHQSGRIDCDALAVQMEGERREVFLSPLWKLAAAHHATVTGLAQLDPLPAGWEAITARLDAIREEIDGIYSIMHPEDEEEPEDAA